MLVPRARKGQGLQYHSLNIELYPPDPDVSMQSAEDSTPNMQVDDVILAPEATHSLAFTAECMAFAAKQEEEDTKPLPLLFP